ncbi:MAG: diaminopimelate decarboxylase [Alphaproteobacteria bacterium]
MTPLAYRDGILELDGTPLAPLAARHGTPLYVYAAGEIRRRLARLEAAFAPRPPLFCYALKANPTLAVVATLARAGAGADVVSGGELTRAQAAGVPPARIVFAGVGKSRGEIEQGLAAGILQFNVESLEELHLIDAVAAERGVTAPVALRLNPDVAATTHDKIATGRRHDKFGIGAERLGEVLEVVRGLDHVRTVGLHCHIGSQIAVVEEFERAYRRMAELYRHGIAHGLPLERLNLGGGFAIRYAGERELDIAAFAAMAKAVTAELGCGLVFEPGRFLVAAAGALISRILLVKTGSDGRRFVVLDAGMNTLLRPALYGAVHPIFPLHRGVDDREEVVDVVGPICESSDVFARDVGLARARAGAGIALANTGAYGAVMASEYNSRGMAGEVLVDGARTAVVKPPRPPAAALADETVPAWL